MGGVGSGRPKKKPTREREEESLEEFLRRQAAERDAWKANRTPTSAHPPIEAIEEEVDDEEELDDDDYYDDEGDIEEEPVARPPPRAAKKRASSDDDEWLPIDELPSYGRGFKDSRVAKSPDPPVPRPPKGREPAAVVDDAARRVVEREERASKPLPPPPRALSTDDEPFLDDEEMTVLRSSEVSAGGDLLEQSLSQEVTSENNIKSVSRELFTSSDIALKTEVSHDEIGLITRLDFLGERFGLSNMGVVKQSFLSLRVSKDRKSRSEFIDALNTERRHQQGGGMLSKLFGGGGQNNGPA